jgi:hypothetical protein
VAYTASRRSGQNAENHLAADERRSTPIENRCLYLRSSAFIGGPQFICRNRPQWRSVTPPRWRIPRALRSPDFGAKGERQQVSQGAVTIHTLKDPVGAPIFYRDVPLMPSESEKAVIKPLAQGAVPLIAWRLRSIGERHSRLLLEGMHACANCHSFSGDGGTMGMDLGGAQNEKALYAIASVRKSSLAFLPISSNWICAFAARAITATSAKRLFRS